MRLRRYIYLFFLESIFEKTKNFFNYFYIKKNKPFFFNNWSNHKKYWDLSEIEEMAFRIFGKKPAKVQFFSQSKFGLCSYKIFYPESNYGIIKCRECFSENNAQVIEELTSILNKNRVKVAPFLARYKYFIFSKWIKGETIKWPVFFKKLNFLERLAKYQASLHATPFPRERQHFGFLEFLKKRFIFFGSQYFKLEELRTIVKKIEEMTPSLKPSITHSDFTIENIILDQGEPILIDNEVLNVDIGYEYDIINAQRNFFPHSQALQKHYLALYKKYHSVGTLESNFDYWELIYFLKSAGSCFQQGDFRQGKKMVNFLKKKLLNLSI